MSELCPKCICYRQEVVLCPINIREKTRKLVLIVGMTALFGLILNENVRMIGNSMKAGIFTGQIRSAYKAEDSGIR